MCENNINFDDYSGYNNDSSSESCCSSENNFYFKVDDTLDENFSNLNKELASQLIVNKNELNTLKILIVFLVIYILCRNNSY